MIIIFSILGLVFLLILANKIRFVLRNSRDKKDIQSKFSKSTGMWKYKSILK